jgi:hypothetical protein
MKLRGIGNSNKYLLDTRDTPGGGRKMKARDWTVQDFYISAPDGLDFRSIAQRACKCLVVVAGGLALTSCSATLAKWTSSGGPSQPPGPMVTSGSQSVTPNMGFPQSPTPVPQGASCATSSRVPFSGTSPRPGGSVLGTTNPVCPQSIPGPQPMPEWAVKFLQEMQARGLAR